MDESSSQHNVYTLYIMKGTLIYRWHAQTVKRRWKDEGHTEKGTFDAMASTDFLGTHIDLYSAPFIKGTNVARYTILHETYHVLAPDKRPLLHEYTERLIDATGSKWDRVREVYEPRGWWASWYSVSHPGEDAAESWAGYMFGGDWDDLMASDRHVFSHISPSFADPPTARESWALQLVTDVQQTVYGAYYPATIRQGSDYLCLRSSTLMMEMKSMRGKRVLLAGGLLLLAAVLAVAGAVLGSTDAVTGNGQTSESTISEVTYEGATQESVCEAEGNSRLLFCSLPGCCALLARHPAGHNNLEPGQ